MTMEIPEEQTGFADIDRHFARFIGRFGGDRKIVETTAALLSRSVREGHICLEVGDPNATCSPESTHLPRPAKWLRELENSKAFGPPAGGTPIVLASNRLYLRRYWDYEQSLASEILKRARRNKNRGNTAATQDAAVEAALQNYFTIISGGPGTGKTTTVLQILQRLVQEKGGDTLRIALAAPTGKAAARLQELLRKVQEDPGVNQEVKERLPRTASTIQRLLGWRPDSVFFRHDAGNPLAIDLLVVDEASMVALPLMAKLFDALTDKTRVILLGDRDQLASVEPGAVLADMADAALASGSPLQNSLIVLSRNYRFGNENAIHRLASAVRAGDADTAVDILHESDLNELGSSNLPVTAQLPDYLEKIVIPNYKSCLAEKDPALALAALQRFRVLCALREGPFGVNYVNKAIESILYQNGLITDPTRLYAGQPLLVTRNDYQTRLFNGDIGIVLPDPADGAESGQLWAWFSGQDNELRRVAPARLPDSERAFAMTVHKSQGSEFERVLFILPDRDSPVVTRELIYTGLTRASKRVDVWFKEDVFRASVERKAMRRSGLREALYEAPAQRVQAELELDL
jgi:exodeoxyribonuclease V alpha subunit